MNNLTKNVQFHIKEGTKMNFKKILMPMLLIVLSSALLFAGCNPPEQTTVVETAQAADSTTPAPTNAIVTATPIPEIGDISFTTEINQDVINILLVGNDSDSIESDGRGRNDTTMVLQINRIDNTMKLISFMRDMVFDIPGIGETSINNAWYYGGYSTLSKLMESEFDLSIDYYASISFNSFRSVMDIIGKVTIDPSDNVIPDINSVDVYASKNPTDMSPESSLTYVRDRHNPIVDPATGYTLYSDEARNYRQRIFILSTWEQVKSLPAGFVPVGVFGATIYLDTNMDEATMITLITEMMDAGATIETLGLPARNSSTKPYYSLYEDLNTEEILSKSEIEAIYSSASDAGDYATYEDWKDAHYKVSHIIGWNVTRTTQAVENFLITD